MGLATPTSIMVATGRAAELGVQGTVAGDDILVGSAGLMESHTVAMITGDAPATAQVVADQLGIDKVVANVRPEGKTAALETLRRHINKIAFVGDGINEAPTLAGRMRGSPSAPARISGSVLRMWC